MEKKYFNKVLLINETFIVDHSVFDEWITFFKNNYMKNLQELSSVNDVLLSKVRGDYNPDGENYALQFKINEMEYHKFKTDKKLLEIRKVIDEKFRNRFASFVTVLEIQNI